MDVVQPLSYSEKLRIQFTKALRRGHITNVVTDPTGREAITLAAHDGETFIVRIQAKTGKQYWFSSVRLLEEAGVFVTEIVRYGQVESAHWMFSDLRERTAFVRDWARFKADKYDRIELGVGSGFVVVEGLDQAYSPVLRFFQWITGDRDRRRAKKL